MCVKDMLFAGFAPRHQLAVCVVVLSDVCVERSPRLWHSNEARHRPPAVHPLVCFVFMSVNSLCVWLSSPRCFPLLLLVSALFPCLVVFVIHAWYFASIGGLSRVVVASRRYFACRSSYVGSSQGL